ncbi:hypothetical protein OAI12_00900 [Porticoccaceae bacterium]|nr:hypothetical protein [Porticoccaceae bacterium]
MDRAVAMVSLAVTKVSAQTNIKGNNSVSGSMSVDAVGKFVDQAEDCDEAICLMPYYLSLELKAMDHKGDKELFNVSIDTEATFRISREYFDLAKKDTLVREDVSADMAHAIYVGVRSYFEQTFSILGVKNVHMPWVLDLGDVLHEGQDAAK